MKYKNEQHYLRKIKELGGEYYCTHKGVYDSRRVTTVWVRIDDKTYQGNAECSHKDIFNKNLGRSLAMKRAMLDYKNGETGELPEYLKKFPGIKPE